MPIKISKNNKYNWPGWDLKDNPFGKDFNLAARKRMVAGGKLLYLLIKKYKARLGNKVLEVGPFFDPLISTKLFKYKKIYYLDNDPFVLSYLKKKYKKAYLIPYNIDLIGKRGKNKLNVNGKFDSIIISQVFNYINCELLLKILKRLLKRGGYIFINNVANYGIPALFSEKRPKSLEETIKTIKAEKFKIVERRVIKSKNRNVKKDDRLLLVVKI
jgi:hypothetical protein